MSDGDVLLDRLKQTAGRKRGIDFCSASDPVVEGHELEDTGNRYYGQSVYVATGKRYEPSEAERFVGATIRIGTVEHFDHAELRCWEKGKFIAVAVFDDQGRQLSRELICRKGQGDEVDEGQLAWFGPKEDICTPWSDNAPAQCQVITVHRLRSYARSLKYADENKKQKNKKKR